MRTLALKAGGKELFLGDDALEQLSLKCSGSIYIPSAVECIPPLSIIRRCTVNTLASGGQPTMYIW